MPRYFTEENATEVVKARHADAPDRLRQIMDSVVTHLHAVVREVEPTQDEWLAAIRFLTRTGQICDDQRQEFILLSDTLGVSMLLDAIHNRTGGVATESTVLGPFHVDGAPALPRGGDLGDLGDAVPTVIEGRVAGPDGEPLAGATLDVWQTDPSGVYDVQRDGAFAHDWRGIVTTDDEGRFWFRTLRPKSYTIPDDGPVGQMLGSLGRHPWRPAHIHFIVRADGYQPLTTHLFVAGDEYLASDTVFGVKEALIVEPVRVDDPSAHPALGQTGPFDHMHYDFVLLKASTP